MSCFGRTVSEQPADTIGRLAKGVVCLPDRDTYRDFDCNALDRRMWCRVPEMPARIDDPEYLTKEQRTALT